MSRSVILDTGPLIALLNPRDRHHGWARANWEQMQSPLLTCEAVVTEACYLARRLGTEAPEAVLEFLQRGVVDLSFRLADETAAVAGLLRKYRNIPMSLADGCIVRMSEQHTGSVVFTLDTDFAIYRKDGRYRIPVLSPKS